MADRLFAPLAVGAITAPNRVLMAPLTRNRAGRDGVPGALAPEYYRQRASAGLIVTEATQVSQAGQGYASTPGIFTPAQVAGWRKVTDAVHAAGGRILLQLWHVGRISHPDLQPGGALPVAPSAIKPAGGTITYEGQKPFVTPRALETDEIAGVVEEFREGAANAKAAGFDGVEIHAANGYLIDQFLRDGTNKRTDRYGDSVANRGRFLLEVVDAVVGVWGADRVGVRLSPLGSFNDMSDSDPAATFGHAIATLDRFGLAYLHLVEAFGAELSAEQQTLLHGLRGRWHGVYIANGSYTRESAEKAIADGHADAITFGKLFLANPDLPQRLASRTPLNEPDQSTFYGGDHRGYTDYPPLTQAA